MTPKHPQNLKSPKQIKHLSALGKFAASSIFVLVLLMIITPFFTPYTPDAIDLNNKFAPISKEHWLGSDHLGRDIFTRIVYGAHISLGAVGLILLMVVSLGITIGGISGALGGVWDRIIMRLCDIFLSLPTIVLSLFFIGILGSGLSNIILAITLTHWAWYARIVRSIVLQRKHKEFVLLSSMYGASFLQNFRRNMLPPIATQCLVLATMDIGHMMLHIAGLSFLGLGVQPQRAVLGIMLSEVKDFLWSAPHLLLYPGLALFISVALFNLLGDSLRDYFDVETTTSAPKTFTTKAYNV